MTQTAGMTVRTFIVATMEFRVYSSVFPDTKSTRTFVLVHGIGTSHQYFSRLHAELAEASDVHSVDLPGFGGTSKPTTSPTVEEMSSALGTMLETIATGPVVLVGHSMGAQWVVELAATRPDLVAGLVALGPVVDDAHRSLPSQGLRLLADILFEPPGANVLVFADYLRCGSRWFLKQSRQMVAYRIEKRLPQVAAPVLLIRGTNDPIAGTAWCRRLRELAGFASMVVVPRARHVVQWSAATAVAAAIGEFAARTPETKR